MEMAKQWFRNTLLWRQNCVAPNKGNKGSSTQDNTGKILLWFWICICVVFVFVLSLYLCCLVPIRAMGRSTQDNTFPQPFLHNKVLFSSERRCMLLIIVAPQHTTYARCLSQFVICTAETERHFWRPNTSLVRCPQLKLYKSKRFDNKLCGKCTHNQIFLWNVSLSYN